MMLTAGEVQERAHIIEAADVFHFGTLSMTDEEVSRATEKALDIAKSSGCLISFDPNYRAPLWKSKEAAIEKIRFGLSRCDVLKISDNEIELLTGETDIEAGVAAIRREFDIKLICATLGEKGSKAYYGDLVAEHGGFKNPATIETTGAGDTFCGSMLHFVHKYGIDSMDTDKLEEMLRFANGAASLITTRRGALAVMPYFEEVMEYIG